MRKAFIFSSRRLGRKAYGAKTLSVKPPRGTLMKRWPERESSTSKYSVKGYYSFTTNIELTGLNSASSAFWGEKKNWPHFLFGHIYYIPNVLTKCFTLLRRRWNQLTQPELINTARLYSRRVNVRPHDRETRCRWKMCSSDSLLYYSHTVVAQWYIGCLLWWEMLCKDSQGRDGFSITLCSKAL